MEPMAWWQSLLITLATGLGTVLIGLLGRALNKLFNYLAEKSNLAFLGRVDETMMAIVTDLYNTEVEALKAAAADGKLTAEEKAMLKTKAVDSLKSWLGPKGVGELGKIFNGSADAALAAHVEKAVTIAKNAGKLAKKSDPQ